MKRIEVMKEHQYICGGRIYELDKDKQVISGISPQTVRNKKGSCKSNSACVRFVSNAPVINIECSITDKFVGELSHTGITAQCGLACAYRIIDEENWHNIDCYSGRENTFSEEISLQDFIPENKKYELVIYGPIYSYLCDLVISVDEPYEIEPVSDREMKKVLFLGGPATYGAGVTSSSLMFSNILMRRFPIVSRNISFYWWNWIEDIDVLLNKEPEILADIDIIFLEFDSARMSYDVFSGNLERVVMFLMEHTDARVVLWNYPVQPKTHRSEERNDLVKEMVQKFSNEHDRIVLCNNYFKWTEKEFDMYSYGSNFINDNGNIWIYKALQQYVEELCRNI